MRRQALTLTDRVCWLFRVLVVVLGLQAIPAFSDSVYVPLVITQVPQASPAHPVVVWLSTFTLTNPTDSPLTYRHLRVFGGRGAYIEPLVVNLPLTVRPHDLAHYGGIYGGMLASPGDGPGFLELDVDPGLVVTTGITLTEFRNCYRNLNPPVPQPVYLATAPMPVYRALFPADAVAASGDVALPRQFPLDHECHVETAPVFSRVNVTILNAGQVEATATIRYASGRQTPYVLTVPAGAVLQLNDIFPGTTFQNALLVSATQPFLAYASSVVSWSGPNQAPAIAVIDFRSVP